MSRRRGLVVTHATAAQAARSLAAAVALVVVSWAAPARAEFRFDVEPREFELNDEYYLNLFSYERRLTYRWIWDDYWEDAAIGYDISAGSVRSDELFVDQRARVRLPFGDHLSAAFRFVEAEDFDQRYEREEVELVFRVLRPDWKLPLSETTGWTPKPDGLFVGGTGEVEGSKEFADIGFVAGWRGDWLAVRVDAIAVDYWFNKKNQLNAEYTSEPYTFKGEVRARLLQGRLNLAVWAQNDTPLRLVLPERDGGLVFRYRQLRGGLNMAWWIADGVRLDLRAWAERTEKRRRSPLPAVELTDDLDRKAERAVMGMEVDVEPLLGSASRVADTVLIGLFLQRLEEERTFLRDRSIDETIRRGEAYGQLGYVLALPSPGEEYRFALRAAAYAGFISYRDVRPDEDQHSVSERFLAKLGLGFEASFREDRAYGFLQLTWDFDEMTFGGGNAQVMFTF